MVVEIILVHAYITTALLFKDIFQQFGIDVQKQFSSELHKMADLGVLDVSEDAFMITHQGFWCWTKFWGIYLNVEVPI